jgi:hypothetical protein
VFDNEQSLHLWKTHPCTSTVERQLTDWREQVTTWRDLRGLLYSQSNTVFINPIELYWIAAINKYFKTGSVTFRSLCMKVLASLTSFLLIYRCIYCCHYWCIYLLLILLLLLAYLILFIYLVINYLYIYFWFTCSYIFPYSWYTVCVSKNSWYSSNHTAHTDRVCTIR